MLRLLTNFGAKRAFNFTPYLLLLTFSFLLTACDGQSESKARPEAATEQSVKGDTEVASARSMHVYKSPTCGCCGDWVDHVEDAGFATEVTDTDKLDDMKKRLGIERQYQSCHTAVIGDYFFEGHIPAEVIERFLEERPDALGLAVPGMPVGSPGMEMGDRFDAYDVVIINRDGSSAVYQHIEKPGSDS